MRRLWPASAAITVCLALGGSPALGQEVSPSASAPPATAANPADTAAQVTVQIADLAGMEGLEIEWGVAGWPRPGASWTLGGSAPIDASPFTLPAGTVSIEPGVHLLVVFAGRPDCWIGYGPVCAPDSEGNAGPDYGCATRFDAQAGEAITMGISGLPVSASRHQGSAQHPFTRETLWALGGGCTMTDVLHGAVATANP